MLLVVSAILFFLGGPILYNLLHVDRLTPERTGLSKAINKALLVLTTVLLAAFCGTIFFYLERPNQTMLHVCCLVVVLDCSTFFCFRPRR